MKRVSIVLPVYNEERYIHSAIQSVFDQTYTNWELIIVNDGSTDRTLDICRSFVGRNAKIISQSNQGLSRARNAGIRNSHGEYIAFLDADDIWLANKLERQVAFLDSNPLVGLVTCGSRLLDEEGKQLGVQQAIKAGNIKPIDIFLLNPIKNGSLPLLRRQTLEDIRFEAEMASNGTGDFEYFDPKLYAAEDLDCWLRIALETDWEIWGIPDCSVYYRIKQSGLSSSLENYHSAWIRIQQKIESSHPLFFQKHSRLAKAFEYRYLTQRGIWTGAKKTKVLALSLQMLHTDVRITLKDPFVTFLTAIGAWSYFLLPRSDFQRILFPIQRMLCFFLEKESTLQQSPGKG